MILYDDQQTATNATTMRITQVRVVPRESNRTKRRVARWWDNKSKRYNK